MELNQVPAAISTTIMMAVIHVTSLVLRSAPRVSAPNTCSCCQLERFSVCMCRSYSRLPVKLHDCNEEIVRFRLDVPFPEGPRVPLRLRELKKQSARLNSRLFSWDRGACRQDLVQRDAQSPHAFSGRPRAPRRRVASAPARHRRGSPLLPVAVVSGTLAGNTHSEPRYYSNQELG